AIAADVGIECDVQVAGTGTPVVFHDETLERLTSMTGPISNVSPDQLGRTHLMGPDGPTPDVIEPLSAILKLISGRVPLLIEVKGSWHAATAPGSISAIAEVVRAACGPIALKSFHPEIVRQLRSHLPDYPIGIVARDFSKLPANAQTPPLAQRGALTNLRAHDVAVDFVSYHVESLASEAIARFKRTTGVPVFTWTVRTRDDLANAARHANAAVFEALAPSEVRAAFASQS
ncbi:MAG: glycerophosphodiester phosphodiesterase family protein, partial [Pseudomonadota bacterium]